MTTGAVPPHVLYWISQAKRKVPCSASLKEKKPQDPEGREGCHEINE